MASFYVDHDISRHLVGPLQTLGHDALAAFDAGLGAAHDGIQLLTATQQGRLLVSHNWKDFRLLHRAWLHWTSAWQVPLQHAAIIVVPQRQWTVDHMAIELDRLVATEPPIAGGLYRWYPGGWTRQE